MIDPELVARACAGERAAVVELLRVDVLPRAARVVARAVRHVPPHVDREDVLQDVAIDVVAALAKYAPREGGSFAAWINTVIRHAARYHARRYASRLGLVYADDPGGEVHLDELPDGRHDLDQGVAVRRALATLSPQTAGRLTEYLAGNRTVVTRERAALRAALDGVARPARAPIAPGQRFGRLTALARAPRPGQVPHWSVACDCGARRVVRSDALASGGTQSCGGHRALAPEIVARVRESFARGSSKSTVARDLNISESVVRKILRAPAARAA